MHSFRVASLNGLTHTSVVGNNYALVTFSTGESHRDSTRAFRRTVSTKYYLRFACYRIVKVDGVSIHKLLYNPV